MLAYIARRLLLMVPTLLGIMVVNFIIVQAAPGGPVELMIAPHQGTAAEATARVGGRPPGRRRPRRCRVRRCRAARGAASTAARAGSIPSSSASSRSQFGFDQPAHERFLRMMRSYVVFDFGTELLPRPAA